jgi:hypothetical protein
MVQSSRAPHLYLQDGERLLPSELSHRSCATCCKLQRAQLAHAVLHCKVVPTMPHNQRRGCACTTSAPEVAGWSMLATLKMRQTMHGTYTCPSGCARHLTRLKTTRSSPGGTSRSQRGQLGGMCTMCCIKHALETSMYHRLTSADVTCTGTCFHRPTTCSGQPCPPSTRCRAACSSLTHMNG